MINRIWRFVAIATAALGLLAHAGSAMAAPRTLSGTVTYRERIALPASARVEVRLADVSLADAPSKTIARTVIRPRGQVPVHFRLRYDDSKIRRGHSYALEARITVDGRLWFISTTRYAVFAGGADDTDILVERVGGQSRTDAAASPAGRWLLEDIRGRGVIDNLQTVLQIAADGTVGGTGGCNGMGSKATVKGSSIRFTPVVATMKACAPAVLDQEGRFFKTLEAVRAWRIDPARGKLLLLGAGGKPLLTLARM